MIDLLPYFLGERVYKLSTGETFHVETTADGWFYHVKNSQYEQLYYNDAVIGRGVDTSPGSGNLYIQLSAPTLQPHTIGAAWLARHMEVGQTFTRKPFVYWRTKDNRDAPGQQAGWIESSIRFVAHYARFTFASGLTIPDVIELKWDVPGGETYWYARGYGLVGWKGTGQQAYITGEIDRRFAEARELIPWVDALIPPTAPQASPQTAPAWKPATLISSPTNFRTEPIILSSTLIRMVDTGTALDLDVNGAQVKEDGTWNRVRINGQTGYMRTPPAVFEGVPNAPPAPAIPDNALTSPFLTRDELQQLIELDAAKAAALRAQIEAAERLRLTAVQLADTLTRLLDAQERAIELLEKVLYRDEEKTPAV